MFIQAAVAVAAVFAPAQTPGPVEPLIGRWVGSLTLPDGNLLPVVLRISKDADGKIVAVADEPMSGTNGIPVNNLTLTGDDVRFEVTGVAGQARAKLSGETIEGDWVGPEGELPLSLSRAPAA